MKIKADHYWATDGEVVVSIRDHDSPAPLRNNGIWGGNPASRRVEVLYTARYPRGLAGKALRDVKRTLVTMWKTKLEMEQS